MTKKLDMKAVKKELDEMFDNYKPVSKKGSGAPEGTHT